MRAWVIAAWVVLAGCGDTEKPGAPGGDGGATDTAAGADGAADAGGDDGPGGGADDGAGDAGTGDAGAGADDGSGTGDGGDAGSGAGSTDGGGTGGDGGAGAEGTDGGTTGSGSGTDTGGTGGTTGSGSGTDTGGTGGTTGSGSGGDTGTTDPDSDGDGFTDSAESAAGTDPADRYSRPYAGGYTLATCAPRPTATGPRGTTGSGGGTRALYLPGDIVSDLALTDQYGETVDLASFCANDVLVILAAAWCGVCRAEAPALETLQATWGPSGVQVVVLLVENTARTTPSAADAATWATTHGLRSVPVLAVRSRADWTAYERDMAFPSAIHLRPGLLVDSVDQGADDPAAW